jgi:hypothetical protein
MMLLMLAPLCAPLCLFPPDSTPALVRLHVERYPLMRVQDVYKMLYQGEFGIGHLLGDGRGARRYLLEEVATMDTTDRAEELLEPVSADGGMVRVNLRPFRRSGVAPDLLLQAMMATAAGAAGDTARFVATWRSFVSSDASRPFDREELRLWDARVSAGDIRVAHHSPAYETAYHPAYRVCRRDLIEAALRRADGGGR